MDDPNLQESPNPQPVVQIGTHVVIELLGASVQGERLGFDLVPDEFADLAKGFLGAQTPLARAICGQPAASTIPYRQADITSVRILSVVQAKNPPDNRAARKRKDVVRKAVEEAQRTDAIVFASSFSGKWGDYDPQGMEHWDKKDE